MVAVVAFANRPAWSAITPAVRVRLNAITARTSQALFAVNTPEGRCASGPALPLRGAEIPRDCCTSRSHLIWLAFEGGLAGCCCAQALPERVRDDVVRVARNREAGVTIEQIAKDFGVHPMTLQKWMRRADIDVGTKPGQSRTESAELHEPGDP